VIEIDGQFTLLIKVLKDGADSGVVLAPADFEDLILIEESGNQLPTFELNLRLISDEEIAHFHEGNVLHIQIGNRNVKNDASSETLLDAQFVISKMIVKRDGLQVRRMRILGVYNALGYATQKKMTATDAMCGSEALAEVAKRSNFEVDTNIEASTHKQIWIQPNITDKKFLGEIWRHTYVQDSFPVVGLTLNHKIRIIDPKKALSGEADWTVSSYVDASSNFLHCRRNYEWTSTSGFVNHWAGYGFDIPEMDRDRDSYEYNDQTDAIKPTFSNSDAFDRNKETQSRTLSQHWYSDNCHDKYWHTKYENLTYLALSSTIMIKCQLLRHPVGELHVLDTVNFLDNSGDTPSSVAGLYSGNYLIKKTIRTISTGIFDLYLELVRDSANFDAQGSRR